MKYKIFKWKNDETAGQAARELAEFVQKIGPIATLEIFRARGYIHAIVTTGTLSRRQAETTVKRYMNREIGNQGTR